MEPLALDSEDVLLPLLFNMDERPLAAAEVKMLDTGEGQEFIRSVFGFDMRSIGINLSIVTILFIILLQ